MAQSVCRIVGFLLMAVGFVGFAAPSFLGMHLTPIHNIIHIVSGALALYFGYSAPGGARRFSVVFGSIYTLLGVVGFVAPSLVGDVIAHGTIVNAGALVPDNVVHVLLGCVFLVAGLSAAGVSRKPIGMGKA